MVLQETRPAWPVTYSQAGLTRGRELVRLPVSAPRAAECGTNYPVNHGFGRPAHGQRPRGRGQLGGDGGRGRERW